jgi:hypothetical protein
MLRRDLSASDLLNRLMWLPKATIIVGLVAMTYWAFDRKPPFVVHSARVVPPSIPGGALLVEGEVSRDVSRPCDLTVHHWVEDSQGYRHYLPVVQMPAESIKRLEQSISPGRTKFSTMLATAVPFGAATYHAENQYVCNPVHVLLPISVITRIPFTVTSK